VPEGVTALVVVVLGGSALVVVVLGGSVVVVVVLGGSVVVVVDGAFVVVVVEGAFVVVVVAALPIDVTSVSASTVMALSRARGLRSDLSVITTVCEPEARVPVSKTCCWLRFVLLYRSTVREVPPSTVTVTLP
jgi:hypothetical protein